MKTIYQYQTPPPERSVRWIAADTEQQAAEYAKKKEWAPLGPTTGMTLPPNTDGYNDRALRNAGVDVIL